MAAVTQTSRQYVAWRLMNRFIKIWENPCSRQMYQMQKKKKKKIAFGTSNFEGEAAISEHRDACCGSC